MPEVKKKKRTAISLSKQKKNAQNFVKYWEDRGYEKGEGQVFWLTLLRDVYGIKEPEKLIEFESKVKLDNAAFIDGYIDSTKTLIEQKSKGVNLDAKIKHGNDSLTPFEQAKRYVLGLPVSKHPRWIITCNFEEFRIYDMEQPNGLPFIFRLDELPEKAWQLEFIINKDSLLPDPVTEISIKAGDIIGEIYDELLKQYKDPDNPHSLESLNVLCTRLVFLLYAQSAGILGSHNILNAYLEQSTNLRKALKELFKVLDTPYDERDPYIDEDDPLLADMPYINGGLFADEDIEIPAFTPEIKNLLMKKAMEMDFSKISPTVFGSIFESCLDPVKRRSGGMHYTSLRNIHKVIDPLFLDDLKAELNKILKSKGSYKKTDNGDRIWKSQAELLREFQDKLANIIILDPAAGSGNFLTESYIQLRRLENQIIAKLYQGHIALDLGNQIKVSLDQFYGIEINDFAVAVAKTALWIAESQMLEETQEVLQQENIEFFPLKSYANIIEGNALRMDWQDLVDKRKLSYIIGNPPFSGKLTAEQKKDRELIFDNNGGGLDYVACWFKKATDFIEGTLIQCCFVATNSITQGQQIVPLWKPLLESGMIINFAYKSFVWNSESLNMAQVHCVIIGFSRQKIKKPFLFEGEQKKTVDNINPYLMDGPNILVQKRKLPFKNIPYPTEGFKPADNGYLLLDDDEKNEVIKEDPRIEKWIKPFISSKEFLNGKKRWCLWLVEISPSQLRSIPFIYKRVSDCKEWREHQSKSGDAYKLRDIPHLMRPNRRFKKGEFIVLPLTSSENRKYIPFAYLEDGIPGNSVFALFNASKYMFGILTSSIHMSWMRTVGSRLKSDYRYSSDLVYNTFPWPDPTPEQRKKIEQAAQEILEVRQRYPDASLADLYDDLTMPEALRKAHAANDRAVMEAYGFELGLTEQEIVAELFKKYQKLIEEK